MEKAQSAGVFVHRAAMRRPGAHPIFKGNYPDFPKPFVQMHKPVLIFPISLQSTGMDRGHIHKRFFVIFSKNHRVIPAHKNTCRLFAKNQRCRRNLRLPGKSRGNPALSPILCSSGKNAPMENFFTSAEPSFYKAAGHSSFNVSKNSRSLGVSSAFSSRSGRYLAVRRRDSSRRHFSMLAWWPDSSTSGTACPRQSAGRV